MEINGLPMHVLVVHAVVVLGPLAGLALLDGLDLPGHRLPGVRGQLLARAGRTDEAVASLAEAVALCGNEAERDHLAERLSSLRRPPG